MTGTIFALQFLVFAVAMASQSGHDSLSREQKLAVAELKELLKNDLTRDYMKEDQYLARWLGKQNFNVEETLPLLREYLNLRRDLSLDSILEENWSDMRVLFPVDRRTRDKTGRPVLYSDWNDWNTANFMEGGEAAYSRFLRYFLMNAEETAAHLRQLRSHGSNVTKFTSVINAAGFTPEKHACPLCTKVSKDISAIHAKYLSPVETEHAIIINTPNSFKAMFSQLPEKHQKKIRVYGQDRNQWEQALLETIDLDKLPTGILEEPVQKDNSEGLLNVKWMQA